MQECLLESYHLLNQGARVKDHLLGLALRFTTETAHGSRPDQRSDRADIPEVLFVCVHNAGRSQMTAALLEHHAPGTVHVRSAGSAPADTINPAVIQAIDELGLDPDQEIPQTPHQRSRSGRRRGHHHAPQAPPPVTPDQTPPAEPGTIPLTIPAIKRLLAAVLQHRTRRTTPRHWLNW